MDLITLYQSAWLRRPSVNGRLALMVALATPVLGVPAIAATAMLAADTAQQPAVDEPATEAMSESERAAAVDALVASIAGAIASVPADASAEDFEAAIVLSISQSGAADDIALAAIDRTVPDPSLRQAVIQALRDVRLALLNRRLRRGTAGIEGSAFGPSASAAPGLSVSGGSVDYTL